MQSTKLLISLALTALLTTGGGYAHAQQSIFHDPFLNWDFINFTDVDADDFEIVVARPNWAPPQVYTGFFPNFTTRPDAASGGTILSWSGNAVPPGGIAHVGAAMMGSGPILDAYWTINGHRVGPSIAIVYERTQIFPLLDGSEVVAMNLQVSPNFEGTAGLANIRTFSDLPANLLGLDQLTRALDPHLDMPPLSELETIPTELISMSLSGPITAPLQPVSVLPAPSPTIDSFFDVFVDITTNTGPAFESLLTADVVVFNPTQSVWQPIGRFWNLNPQSPEPASIVLAGIVCVTAWGMSRKRAANTTV
jgi:hypothetical protein